MYTYYTSFSFLVVSLLTQGSWIQPALSVLSCLSILHHAKYYERYFGRKYVQLADRVVSHAIGVKGMYEVTRIPHTYENAMVLMVLYSCASYVAIVYHRYLRNNDLWLLHKTIHIVSAFALWLLYQMTHNPTLVCQRLCPAQSVPLLTH